MPRLPNARHALTCKVRNGYHYSRPILASSPIPQSPFLARCGRCPGKVSSSPLSSRLPFPVVLVRFNAPGLSPELLVLEVSSRITSEGGFPLMVEAMVFVRERCCSVLTSITGSGGGEEQGLLSVLAVTSTSSASRYHLRRRVYLAQPS